jgi:hypothetical protein
MAAGTRLPCFDKTQLFAFGSPDRSGCVVMLDGRPISGELQRGGTSMPSEWWPPKITPTLPRDDRTMIYAGAWPSVAPLAFPKPNKK